MERGFIQGKLEIKLLILYILARADEALDMDTLTDTAMCDDGVTYFDYTVALAELVDTNHVLRQEGKFLITDQGRKNGGIMEDQLPYSVRMRCDAKLERINEAFREEKRVRTALTQQQESWLAELALDSEEGNLFTLSITLPRQEDAQRLIRNFRADPHRMLHTLRNL